MFILLGLLIFSQEATKALPTSGELKIEGQKGIEILGICVDAAGSQKREFEGSLPYQTNLDLNFQRCEVKKKNPLEKGPVTLRLFQKK